MDGERWTAYLRLPDIPPATRNPKRHADTAIATSIEEFGFAELPMLDERTGRLVAGHGRLNQLLAARAAGHPPPQYVRVDADGEWLIPVSRGWASDSDEAAEAYLVASNHLTTIGGWHNDDLAGLLADVRDADPALFTATGFTDAQLDALLHIGDDPDPGDPGDNPGGGHRPAHITRPGDVWHLGPHLLRAAGASTADDLADVDTLCRHWQDHTGRLPERDTPDGRQPVDFLKTGHE